MTSAGAGNAGGRFSLCAPAKAGAAAGAMAGLIVWALVAFVPAFHNGVPQPVTDVLPFALGWLGHVAAAWFARHPAVPAAPAAPALPSAGGGSGTGVTGTAAPGAAFSAPVQHCPPGPGWRRW